MGVGDGKHRFPTSPSNIGNYRISGKLPAAFIRLRMHSSHQVHQQQQDGDRDDNEHRDWEE